MEIRLCVVAMIAFGLTNHSYGAPDNAPPSVLRSENGAVSLAVWVSADVALRDGKLDVSQFDDATRRWIARAEQRAGAVITKGHGNYDCVAEPAIDHFKANRSLGQLTASSLDVVSGHITHTQLGFWRGFPATLLTVAIDDRLKWSGNFRDPESIHVAYPAAMIQSAHGPLCAVANYSNVIPATGDSVLLFVLTKPADADATVAEPQVSREFFFQHGDTLIAPRSAGHYIDLQHAIETTRRILDAERDSAAIQR